MTATFRGAAKKLEISPSVVSHHIAQLEAQLDLPLIYRSTRRLSLTDAGTELLQSTTRMTQAAEEGLAAMQSGKKSVYGRLKITAPASAQLALDRPRTNTQETLGWSGKGHKVITC